MPWANARLFKLKEQIVIAKNRNTFEKRKREVEKKAKAEAKRVRRNKKKLGLEDPPLPELSDNDAIPSQEDNHPNTDPE